MIKRKNTVTTKFNMCHFMHNNERRKEHNPLLYRQLIRHSSEASKYSRFIKALRLEVIMEGNGRAR
jgi:hypothetical protein